MISIVPTVQTCENVQHILGAVWRDQSKSTYCISEHTRIRTGTYKILQTGFKGNLTWEIGMSDKVIIPKIIMQNLANNLLISLSKFWYSEHFTYRRRRPFFFFNGAINEQNSRIWHKGNL